MRKIEQQMNQAIREGQDWAGGNTTVTHTGAGSGLVTLHGHRIAWFADCGNEITVDQDTLEEWPTVTTLSRLRALGADVCRRNNLIYLNGGYVCRAD